VERWGLAVECPTPDAPEHDAEITWLLPDLGLRLTRYRPRRRHSRPGPSTLTAVRIERETRSWTTTDLLLGLEVEDGGRARIAHATEFATAVATGALRLSEADYALRTVHRTLEEVTRHRDLNQWLAYRGIFDIW
jgi:predicted RNA-binding protein associated with RNAse of E/G family